MYWPSARQVGLLTNQRFSLRHLVRVLAVGAITQMFHRPSRSLANAIRLPSGLKRGCMSKAAPLVIRSAAAARCRRSASM